MNVEQIKQEQERVGKLLEGVTEGEWYAYTHFHGTAIYSPRTPSPQERFEPDEHPIHVIAENAGSVDAALIAESQRLARAYAALLAAHAEALERLERAEALAMRMDRYSSTLDVTCGEVVRDYAADLRIIVTAQAPAGAEGGAE